MSMITALQQYAEDISSGAHLPKVAVPARMVGGVELTVYSDPSKIADEWQAMEERAGGCLFQSYKWIDAWARTVARATGEELVVAVGRDDAGKTLFIWPFAITPFLGTKLLTWCSDSQSNYNTGNFDPDFAENLDEQTLMELLEVVADLSGGVSAIYLKSQPVSWQGKANPFNQLPHFSSPNDCYAVQLSDDFESLKTSRMGKTSQRNLRRKEKKLRSFGTFKMKAEQGIYTRLNTLDEFFAQKAEQFKEAGITDVFAAPEIRSFYRDLASGLSEEDESFELFTLHINDDLVATFNGVAYQDRFYLLLASLTQAEYRRWSPGLIVMKAHIERCCERGLKAYDLGSGAGDHKDIWANETIAMFDNFLPVSSTGHAYAVLFKAKTAAKRFIKNNPQIWSFAKKVRQSLGRLKGNR